MTESQLEPIDRFHQELKSLAAVGLSVNLGPDGPKQHLSIALDDIRAALNVRISLGQTLEAALLEEERLPERYRALALAWVRFNAPADVLATITDVQDINPQWSRGVTHSMVQTLVVLVLVTAGLSVASLWLAPKVDALYVQLDQTPPPAARFLSTLRNGLPIWSAATALLLIIFIFLWKRFGAGWASRWANQLPITRRRLHLIRSAELADYLAHWLQQDLPIVDGIRLASGLSDAKYSHTDSKPEHPRQYAPAALTDGDDPHHPALPPLVHWAIADEQSSEPIPLRLQSVASIYRQLANRLFVRWTRLIPITLAAGFCGLAVLIYGLSVFLPIIGLLQDVSAPPVLP